jgi:hypothetical protein
VKAIAKGYVLSVHPKTFWWRFRLQRGLGVWHDGQVFRRKLGKRERPFLQPDAYVSLLKGGTFRFSRVRWKKRDLARAQRSAKVMFTKLFEKH